MTKQKSMEERVDRVERMLLDIHDKLFKLEEELKNHKNNTEGHKA